MARKPDKPGTGAPKARRRVSREESDLFRRAMGDAAPLEKKGRKTAPPGPPISRADPVRTGPRGTPAAGGTLPELSAGRAAGLDRNTMDRLRRGRIRPEARLDLHGMVQDEARAALDGFIAAARGRDRRCVIVITGKGRVSEGGGVLRTQVPRWLNLAPVRGHILGFAEAQPKDGGAGALYVLLRRKR